MTENDQTLEKLARLVALRRRAGASEEALEAQKKHNEEATDWAGTCRYCGKAARGTLRELSGKCPACGAG